MSEPNPTATTTCGRFAQSVDHIVPNFNFHLKASNHGDHGFHGIFLPLPTKRNDILLRLALVFLSQATILVDGRGAGDMCTGENGDLSVGFAESIVEGGCTLEVRVLE